MNVGDMIRFSNPYKKSVGIITKKWVLNGMMGDYYSITWTPEVLPYWSICNICEITRIS
jgi:hypothetical protein